MGKTMSDVLGTSKLNSKEVVVAGMRLDDGLEDLPYSVHSSTMTFIPNPISTSE